MASSKTSREEKPKKKKIKDTEPGKIGKKSSQKSEKKRKIKKTSNGTVKELELLVIPSSSNDSVGPAQNEEDEVEQVKTESEVSNQRKKKSTPEKSKRREKKENEEEEERQNGGDEEKEEEKTCTFPTSRVWRIIKSENDSLITHEAVFLINKASEKFLEQFCEDAYICSVKDRKKSLSYNHLSSVVCKQKRYDFLSDFVPEKVKAKDALAEKKLAETGAG